MRLIKVSKAELLRISKLYKSLMSTECHGLFFREGLVIGEEISNVAIGGDEGFFKDVKEILVSRGWLTDITFEEAKVVVKGSAEIDEETDIETCHRLRGIVQKVLEVHHMKKVKITEVSCESLGAEQCIFNCEFGGK